MLISRTSFSLSFLLRVPVMLFAGILTFPLWADEPAQLIAEPAEVHLERNFARAQVLIKQAVDSSLSPDGWKDVTHSTKWTSADPKIVTVSQSGQLLAVNNGTTHLLVKQGNQSLQVPITVSEIQDTPEIRFIEEVTPVLSKAGCNLGSCHASQYGKGGFVLSVFGFEPKKDHFAITRDRQQRRINTIDPDHSLFLEKATLAVPHGGGKRLNNTDTDYLILKEWVRNGCQAPVSDAATVVNLEITPQSRVAFPQQQQQLRVVAEYSDGSTRDVTSWAKYDSMDEGVLSVNKSGLVTVTGNGQAVALIRFEGQAAISTFKSPYSNSIDLADWNSNNFIDEHAAKKFQELNLQPSPLCDDATFIRRAYLDATGTIPTVEETKTFLASSNPDKRKQLVDELLGFAEGPAGQKHNDAYAAFWTLKWADLIRNQSRDLGDQGMWAFHNWLLGSFRENKPFDQFVTELVTGKGSIFMNGPANYYRVNKNSSDLAESTSQLFLGVRLGCAKCHHHPMEKYSQADYYGFAAFFSRVGTKNSADFGVFGRESVVYVKSSGEVKHPKTNKVLKPKLLEAEEVDHPLDRRIPLAKWITSPENKYFARSIVNRYMGYLLGQGLVEPIDDMRDTNPPSNVGLMQELTQAYIDSGFNNKQLMRLIMQSRLYQLSSQPTAANVSDKRFYSHYRVKRIAAEPLLDAIDRATAAQTKFKDLPLGTRAIALPDAEYPNEFLNTFGKPRRASVCECERMPDENLAQALHSLNGETIAKKVNQKNGRLNQLLNAKKSAEEIVQELYYAALSRPPHETELKAGLDYAASLENSSEAYEDLFWALLNSKQFLFVH